MKNKGLIGLLFVLFALSTIASVIGYKEHKKAEINKPEEKKEQITYEYYLEEQLQSTMPTNSVEDSEISYSFSRYQCDNNVTGSFDTEKWVFIPNVEKESTCKLYFVKNQYEVTLSVTNGIIDGELLSNVVPVVRESDGQFKITPNEGYEYKDVICSNDKEALYDLSTNTLTIHSVMEDVACMVTFDIKELRLDLTVKNGKGTTTEKANYGETITAVVQANDGYEKPKIDCTNDQKATIENNTFKIEKITNNTKCTVTYAKIPIVTYLLKLQNVPETVTITSGNKEQSIVAGKDGKFTLKPAEGYEISLSCSDSVKPSKEEPEEDGSITYTFLSMSKNVTCSVTATEKP